MLVTASQDNPPVLSHETKLCISLSSTPGRFGTTVHNAGYRALHLNYIYKACATQDIGGALTGVRALGIRGCSISMPYKEDVLRYLDNIDEEAGHVGAVNTIVNHEGRLTGFNTDVTGAMLSLQPYLTQPENIMLLGGGGVARAIIQALKKLNQREITVYVREPSKYHSMAETCGVNIMAWSSRHDTEATIVINATPMGMRPHDTAPPIHVGQIPTLKLVMDVIVTPVETALMQAARAQGLQAIDGVTIALHQAYEQFYLYTGVPAPRDIMHKAAMSLLS